MTSIARISLVERRRTLCKQLLVQRQLIGLRLETRPFVSGHYPRSKTLRLLGRQPAVAAAVFAGIATLLVGGRFFRSMTAALTLARILRSATTGGQGRRSVVKTADCSVDSLP